MWYEILLPMGIIFGAMSFGFGAAGLIMKAGHDKPFMKALVTNSQVNHYRRDLRLTGDPYKAQGLEAVADQEY